MSISLEQKVDALRQGVVALRLEAPKEVMDHFSKLVEDVISEAEESEFYIGCLEAGGVDNWEWYDESLEPYYEKYHG